MDLTPNTAADIVKPDLRTTINVPNGCGYRLQPPAFAAD